MKKKKKSQVLPGFELGSTAWKSAILTPRPRNQANLFVSISWKFIEKCKDFAEFFPIFLTFKRAKLRAFKSFQDET